MQVRRLPGGILEFNLRYLTHAYQFFGVARSHTWTWKHRLLLHPDGELTLVGDFTHGEASPVYWVRLDPEFPDEVRRQRIDWLAAKVRAYFRINKTRRTCHVTIPTQLADADDDLAPMLATA